jgi:hypothetical protein
MRIQTRFHKSMASLVANLDHVGPARKHPRPDDTPRRFNRGKSRHQAPRSLLRESYQARRQRHEQSPKIMRPHAYYQLLNSSKHHKSLLCSRIRSHPRRLVYTDRIIHTSLLDSNLFFPSRRIKGGVVFVLIWVLISCRPELERGRQR